MTPSLAPNDAVSNDVMLQRQAFVDAGYAVSIYAEHCADALKSQIVDLVTVRQHMADGEALCLYHHSILWALGEQLVRDGVCQMALKYHNITPVEFFQRYKSGTVVAATLGRKQTEAFVKSGKFSRYIGDSDYNTAELVAAGAPADRSATLAPMHRIDEFATTGQNQELATRLRNGRKNFLFVGRAAPNKGHLHLVETMREYTRIYGATANLYIVGDMAYAEDLYLQQLESRMRKYKLGSIVHFVAKCPFVDLNTYYSHCDAFLLMSEHEGFCVPILEAQVKNLPVVALNRAAVGGTIGADQLLFDELDYTLFATALHRAAHDESCRQIVQAAGRRNYAKYTTPAIRKQLFQVLGIAETIH